MKYITEKYNSLIDFKKSLEREKIGFMPYGFNKEWNGCESEQQANELLLYGDQKSVQLIQTKQKKRFKTTKNTIYTSPIGFTPCMGSVMAGHPNNMYNIRSESYKNSKVINYFYALDVNHTVSHEKIAEVSAKILNVVASLENMNYRVNLYVTSVCNPVVLYSKSKKTDLNTLISLFVRIKDSGKQLNISKVAFPLSNPAMFRWFVLSWISRVKKNVVNTTVLTFDEYSTKTIRESIKRNFKGEFYLDSYYTAENKTEKQILENILK